MRCLISFTGFVFLLIAFRGHAQNSSFSGGNGASVFLCNDGKVYTSGANDFGQLGIGNSPGTNTPIVVPGIGNVGTLSFIKQVSGKLENTVVALSSTGDSVITWGNNDRGQLGSGLTGNDLANNNLFPYRVIGVNGLGFLTNVKYVASGTQTNYAILTNGKVVAWGSADNGALGNGTIGPDATSPVYVLKGLGDTLDNVKSIVAGTNFAIALLQDGTLWGWGENNIGQLAQNTTAQSLFAIQIKGFGGIGFLNNIVSVSCSQTHVMALSALDTTWAWGNNSTGQFGNNSNSNSLTPVVVLNSLGSAPLRTVSAIASGDGFSMALKSDSTVLVWGSNTFGMFGNNTTVSSLNPTVVLNELGSAPLKHITQISTGKYFAFAKEKSGVLLGWGQNSDGQLAMGDNSPRLLPDIVTMPCTWATGPLFIKGIISGPTSVCGATNSGTINISGNNGNIVAWQRSTNNFLNYWVIPSSSSSLAFSNITQKTFYRAVISFNDQLLFSDPFSINVDLPSQGGILSAPDTVCEGTNNGLLSLAGQLGSILQWEYSLDSFATAGVSIANTLPSFNYSNLTVTTFYRAIIQNGVCVSDTSTVVKITVNSLSIGGAITPGNTVCFGTNNGSMSLSGHTGDVIGWEYSSDNFTGFVNPLSNSTITETFLNLTVTTYYRAKVKNGVCPMVYSSTNIITVDPLSSGGSLTPSAVVCTGSNSGALTLGSYVGNIIGWESASDNLFTTINPISNTTPIENYTNLLATTYYRVRIKNGVCPEVYSPFATITTIPVSNGGTISGASTVCTGANFGFVTISGITGVVTEWQSSTDNFLTHSTIINITGIQLYLNLASTTAYRAVIKNGSCSSVYSPIAVVSVDALTQEGVLSSSATLCSGSNVSLSLGGTIVGAIVRWESSTDNFGSIVNPIGNTTTSFNYSNITTTTSYRVLVKNGVCPVRNSNVATIIVDPTSIGGSVNTSTTECSGTNGATLQLTGNVGMVLNWESSEDNFSTITNIPNTGLTQPYTNLLVKTQYRAVVKSGVCTPLYSTVATINVYPVTAGGTISSPAVVCFGNNSGTLNLSGNNGIILHWEKSTDNFFTSTILSNVTSAESYLNLVNTTYYRALVKNGDCAAQLSSVVEITVNPASVGGSITGSTAVCAALNSGKLKVSGYLGTIAEWQTSTDDFVTSNVSIANITDSIVFSNLTVTTYFRPKIQNSGCLEVYPIPAIVSVDPISAGGTLTAPAVVCANSNSGSINLTGETGSVLRWETSTDNFIASINSNLNTTTTENYTNLITTTFYRAVVKSGVCPLKYSNTTAVTVNPSSGGGTIIGAKNVCVEGNSGNLILFGQNGTVLKWESSTNNFTNPSATTSLVTSNTNYGYTNIVVPTSVRAIVQYSPCPPDTSNVLTFIVNPATKAGKLVGDSLVQPGGTASLNLTFFIGVVLQWEYTSDTTSTWKTIAVNANNYSFINLDTSLFVRVLVKSGNCDEKYSPIFRIMVSEIVNRDVKVYPTISPNNDNINDDWIIDNINYCPGNEVKIFNRWGELVYEQRGYDNVNNVWRGQSNAKFTVTGRDLPDGTYFYVIALGNGKPDLSGFVVLNR